MTTAGYRAYLILAVSFLLLFSSLLRSQTTTTSVPPKPRSATGSGAAPAKPQAPTGSGSNPNTTSTKPTPPQEIFKVTINASRVSVTRNGSYGVYADLENISAEVVKVRAEETMLVVQPEIAEPSACVGLEQGIFPAQPLSADQTKPDGIFIQPNEHYKVFWELTRNRTMLGKKLPPASQSPGRDSGCSDYWPKWIDEYLGFVPGEYAFTVEGIVYAPNTKGETIAHTYTETTTLHVGLSQASTALAAFLGALLAYFVVALQPGQDFEKWKVKSAATSASSSASDNSLQPAGTWMVIGGWLHSAAVVLRNALAAGLLGSALTIVASRLSDTQFPIKVSVNDFWGALTIGFISYFIGNRLLSTIIDRFAPPSKNPQGGTASSGGPGVGSSDAGSPPNVNRPATPAAEHLDLEPVHVEVEQGELSHS
jgi:hypothetical protein